MFRIKLYKTWRKVKQVFVKPSLKVYFGSIRKDPNRIPAGPPAIHLFNRNKYGINVHTITNRVMVATGIKTIQYGDKGYAATVYDYSTHKLPGNLKEYQLVWNTKIRRKLRKYGLGWLPPVIYLPYWMKFGIYNYDVCYKWKWDEVRYELPPVFAICFFGLSLSFALHCPFNNIYACDDHYWESILTYLYNNRSGTIKEAIETVGIWERKNIRYFALRPEYVNANYSEEYYDAVSEIKLKREEIII